ncbi:MAG: prephenate dehydrogenase/arogenate dehydrogenase family protein [Armatimonadia bacterium]|nr:prephenate dehydrogenase/arogenate dehydrogenase family protein [Armatimonadia bacterium]
MGTVAIIGIGLMGGSYGLALKERRLADRVIGCARTQSTLDKALTRGAADEVTDDVAAACSQADIVILCQPPDAIVRMMPDITQGLKSNAVVTDAGSVKTVIVKAGEAYLNDPGSFVGGHPMAGSEKTGVENARGDLFEGATYVITPTERTHGSAVRTVWDLAEGLGSRVRVMSPEEHDRAVATASHVPHIVASALARAVLADPEAKEVHGTGLRDTTRVAAGDADLWRQILMSNARSVQDPLRRVEKEIASLRKALASGDSAFVEEWLATGAVMRRELDASRGSES